MSHIRFTNINLSQIDQDILSSFIVRLTAVILDLNYLTSVQTKAIFEKVNAICTEIYMYRVSPKKLGLVFRSHFRPLIDRK